MSSPYRTAALVEAAPEVELFRYVRANQQSFWTSSDGVNFAQCPVCRNGNRRFRQWPLCSPFLKRVVVRGALWWKKRCPLPGFHQHGWCYACGCHFVGPDSNVPEIHEAHV